MEIGLHKKIFELSYNILSQNICAKRGTKDIFAFFLRLTLLTYNLHKIKCNSMMGTSPLCFDTCVQPFDQLVNSTIQIWNMSITPQFPYTSWHSSPRPQPQATTNPLLP